MLGSIKRLIRSSPLGPVARWMIDRTRGAPRPGKWHAQNSRYDRETCEVLGRVLRPDSCGVDVGAHRGGILKEMMRCAPLGTHFAFEPLPHLAAHLRKTFPGARVHEAAVSDHAGTARFVHVEDAPAYSGLRERIYDWPDPALKAITVNVVRLDDVLPDEQSVAFIKLDIEGGEFHALLGAAGTIRRCRPVIVFEAGHRSTGQYGVGPDEVYRLITEQFGYHLSTMQRWLADRSPYRRTAFRRHWRRGTEFYFIAYPR